MATPTDDLRAYVERVQSEYEDPAERDRALASLEGGVKDLLGVIRSYRNDAQLQRGADGGDESQTGSDDGDGGDDETSSSSETS